MVPKSDHLANPRFDKKPSAHLEAHGGYAYCGLAALAVLGIADE